MRTLKTFFVLMKIKDVPVRLMKRTRSPKRLYGERVHPVDVLIVSPGPETTRPPLGSNLEGRIYTGESGDRKFEVEEEVQAY